MERGTNKDTGKLGHRSVRDANGIAAPETRAMEAVHRELLDHWPLSRQETKKADVEEHPKVSHHVGLLSNEPPGAAEMLFI